MNKNSIAQTPEKSSWEVRDGKTVLAHGPMETFPERDERGKFRRSGLKIYVDGKVWKE